MVEPIVIIIVTDTTFMSITIIAMDVTVNHHVSACRLVQAQLW